MPLSTTANNLHRLKWPRLVRWFLKMDAYGGLPEWWQWFIPRCDDWGGVGWSEGLWQKPGDETDFNKPAKSALDKVYKRHDWHYRPGRSRQAGDYKLLCGILTAEIDGTYRKVHAALSFVVFLAFYLWRKSKGAVIELSYVGEPEEGEMT